MIHLSQGLFIGNSPCKSVAMTQMTTRAGQAVSQLTFGAMQFGGTADEKASRAMFDAARAARINHFDTAVGYTNGASETILGRKLGYIGGAGRQNLADQFDRSRRQLNEDAVDLLYLHRFDPETPLAETFETLAQLQSNGLIRYIGVSNYAAWQVMKAQAVAKSLGTKIDAIQPMYSLVKRQSEVEIIPMAHDQGITVVPYSPLGGGLLTGKYAAGGTGRLTEDSQYKARYDQAWMHDTARNLSALASDLGTDAATLAVAWVKTHPTRPRPIISGRSVAQLRPSLAAQGFTMSDNLYDQMTALSVSPPPATDRLEET